MSEISIFQLVSVAEQTGLNFALWKTPETGFLALQPICDNVAKHFCLQTLQEELESE